MRKTVFKLRTIILATITLTWALISGAAELVEVKTITFKSNVADRKNLQERIKLPYVVTSRQSVTDNINHHLYLENFDSLAPAHPEEPIDSADIVPEGIIEQSFVSYGIKNRVFGITLNFEACGAYCEVAEKSYNYDLSSGRFISLKSLFFQGNLAALSRRYSVVQMERYKSLINDFSNQLLEQRKRPLDKEGAEIIDDLQARIEFNRNCLEGIESLEQKDDYEIEQRNSMRFQIKESELVVSMERCSVHATLALDDAGEISMSVPYEEFRGKLSQYGYNLIFGEQVTGLEEYSNFSGQILHGTIGRFPIIMKIAVEKGKIYGVYFYEKYRRPIKIEGRQQGNEIILLESGDIKMDLIRDGDFFEGWWRGKKSFPMKVYFPKEQSNGLWNK